MGKLINIDNGGTLTDVCVIDGPKVYRTKTLTTAYDLSKCLIDGLKKASQAVYGEEKLDELLQTTEYIRYSTTQGTNALVEKKGPRLGLIVGGGITTDQLRKSGEGNDLFDVFVGERTITFDTSLEGKAHQAAAVRAINSLTSAGATRIVVVFGAAGVAQERLLKRALLRAFPSHLLGAVPILYAHELVRDSDSVRAAWTALINAFLHPAMESFLYSAEHKLRAYKTLRPLLIFRNDGASARVAKTIAIKTYSSGPRGGMEAAQALSAHYGCSRLLTMDVGGTSTDIGLVENGEIRSHRRGTVEHIRISMPLCDVESAGVGGSSIIRVQGEQIVVGPESVGSAPGPACFGLGGTEATITDVFLMQGVLDPASYFGGGLQLSAERAAKAIEENIARKLGVTVEEAAAKMEAAWVKKIADSLIRFTDITPGTTLVAFGGAGPLVACRIAEEANINSIIIPGLAAVFSAYGIGFSDVGHDYEEILPANTDMALKAAYEELLSQAEKGMYAEGYELSECEITVELERNRDGVETASRISGGISLPPDTNPSDRITVKLRVTKPMAKNSYGAAEVQRESGADASLGTGGSRTRTVRSAKAGWQDLPVHAVNDRSANLAGEGPAIIEEQFFTCRVEPGWKFKFISNGDVLLERPQQGVRP